MVNSLLNPGIVTLHCIQATTSAHMVHSVWGITPAATARLLHPSAAFIAPRTLTVSHKYKYKRWLRHALPAPGL